MASLVALRESSLPLLTNTTWMNLQPDAMDNTWLKHWLDKSLEKTFSSDLLIEKAFDNSVLM